MIVRILGEGQYEVPEDHRDALDRLDHTLVGAVESDDEVGFGSALGALIAGVRQAGHALADDAFVPSELVIPFADATLVETKRLLADSLPDEG
ncbi:MAG: PspA-associated protein PspAA [Acidimicrobiales bacterium]